MGQLDEPRFESIVRAGCPACGGTAFDIRSFLDRKLDVMLAEPNNEGRWAHDGEKFVDGTYRISCAACQHVVFEHPDCPRCHAPGGLAPALADPSRLALPKRCPACKETELIALALLPSTTRSHAGGGGGAAGTTPTPLADFGDPGYHLVAFGCASCDAATVTQTCPLCDAPGPLRPRP
ncbi:MAG TPA: hypothetical protein VGC42_22775 [Kofleriaceae bacterium]